MGLECLFLELVAGSVDDYSPAAAYIYGSEQRNGGGFFGGLLAWPVAILFMGKAAGDIAFYAYIVPFLVSTVGGSIIAGIILFALEKNGTLKSMQNALNK